MTKFKLLVHSARQIVQVVDNGQRCLKGKQMKSLAILDERLDDGCSLVVDRDGRIAAIGHDSEIKRLISSDFEQIIDASGKSVVPGLVDGHTHPVWAGDRVHEFAMKLAGATYMEVHEAGGGINHTVRHVRQASEDQLYRTFANNLQQMLEAGTTLAECKSGYGLNAEAEIKMLKVIERAKRDPDVNVEISSTYCGAHAIPKGSTAEEATEDVLSVQIPKIKSLMDKGELHVDNIDVFCEDGVFNVDQTRRILSAGADIGLNINFHGEELHRLHSAEMGAKMGARAISHLEEVSEEGMRAMAEAGTVGVVLPTTAYILRLKPPPVRQMIDNGMAVALGSDLNPNAHCSAMPIVMHLACVLMHLSMNESLAAATINAAASLGKSDTHGSLETGKQGDLIILDSPRWEHLVYQLGGYHHVISHVIKAGEVVWCHRKHGEH